MKKFSTKNTAPLSAFRRILVLVLAFIVPFSAIAAPPPGVQQKEIAILKLEKGRATVPLEISPVQIALPPEHVNLTPSGTSSSSEKLQTFPLKGFPVMLGDYPFLTIPPNTDPSHLWGINLELSSKGNGKSDTSLYIGNPLLFSDLISTHLSFLANEFLPKNTVYSLKRKLGLGIDNKWRYTTQNVNISSIDDSGINADFMPGGDLVLNRAMDSQNLETSPWVNFEFTVPDKGLWHVQLVAKVDIGKLRKSILLITPQTVGSGKQKVFLDFFELLHKSHPQIKHARLSDLVLHIILDPASTPLEKAHIALDQISFYSNHLPGQNGKTEKILLAAENNKTDLVAKLEQFGYKGELQAVRGGLTGLSAGSSLNPALFPKITLSSRLSEMIPKAFVGNAEYFNDLNENEQHEVLDQKLFLEPKVLWKAPTSKSFNLYPIDSLALSKAPSSPFLEYTLNIDTETDSYLQVKYLSSSDTKPPLIATITGVDPFGKKISIDRFVENDKPIKIGGLHVKHIALSSECISDSCINPDILTISNIQILNLVKSKVYRPAGSLGMLAISTVKQISNHAQPIWSVSPEYLNLPPSNANQYLQTLKSYAVNKIVPRNSMIQVELEPFFAEQLFLKISGKQKDSFLERLFPLNNNNNQIMLPEMDISSISFLIQTKSDNDSEEIKIKKLELLPPLSNIAQISPLRLWKIPSADQQAQILGNTQAQAAMKFAVFKQIQNGAELNYSIRLISGPPMSYMIRLLGKDDLGEFDRVYPLALEGSIPLSKMELHEIDLLVRGGDGSQITTVQLNSLSIMQADILSTKLFHQVENNPTYSEILSGSKEVDIPFTISDSGEYRIDVSTNDNFSASIPAGFLEKIQPKEIVQHKQETVPKARHFNTIIILGILLLFVITNKLLPKWLPPELHPRLYDFGFWLVTFVMLVAAYYCIFKSGGKNAYSWGGVILIVLYGFAVHWKLRPFLSRKWPYFAERLSAPYFALFIILLLACAVFVAIDASLIVNLLAMMCYFLLIAGVLVEFIQFSKDTSNQPDIP